MTMTRTNRTRTIKLTRPLAEDELLLLESKLADSSAIKKTEINGTQVHIHYDFPAITIGEISAAIHSVLDKKCFTLLQRFYFCIASYREENEKDYLARPSGWHKDIKYIYAYYFDQQQKNKQAGYKKQWQKYTKK